MKNNSVNLSALLIPALALAMLYVGFTFDASGQTELRQIADLNPGTNGSFASNFAAFASSLCFSAYTVSTGREFWRYDGQGISLISNINDTVRDIGFGTFVGNDSNPYGFTPFQGAIYFTAFDPKRGGELWRWDGSNVARVADINPDANDTIKLDPRSSWPNGYTVVASKLFFSANDGLITNYELWKNDGTTTSLAANLHPDFGADLSSYPNGLTAFNGALYFSADDGEHGYELWKYDDSGPKLLEINPGGTSSYPKNLTPFGNKLYFQAYHYLYGYELWQTDGTNVSLVADLNTGPLGSYPDHLTVFNGALYFSADDGTNGFELWRYDGAVLTLVTNLNPIGDAFPKNLTVLGNQLFFSADDGTHGWELWKYDGTTASMVSDLNPNGDSFPENMVVFNNNLYFVATTPDTGYELWRCDGQSIALAADINPGPGSSYPMNLAVFGSELCFSAAQDGLSDWEPWSLKVTNSAALPVSLSQPSLMGTNFVFSFPTESHKTYDVETSQDLAGGTWQLLKTLTGTGSIITVSNTVESAQSFYRVRSR